MELLRDLEDLWGEYDIIIQQFIIQKTLKPCIYRFTRNEKNVYMAECFINNKDISSQVQLFSELYAEVYDKTVQDSAGAMTQNERR